MSNEPARSYITRKILQRRYGRLLKWVKPIVHDVRGPYHPDVFDGFTSDLILSILVCKETLQDLTDGEFFDRFDRAGEVANQAYTISERLTLAELKAVFRQEPVWFAGGFCVEGRQADIQHWARMQRWSLDEAAALSIGFEPCGDLMKSAIGMPAQSDVLAYFFKRKALIEDNFEWGSDAAPRKNTVPDLVRWFDQVELDVPEELLAATDKFHASGIGKKSKSGQTRTKDEKPLDPRERSTLLKMIVSMAINGYGFDPRAERSPILAEIESDMIRLGLDISIDTIRKHLRSCAGLLDPEVLDDRKRSERIKKE